MNKKAKIIIGAYILFMIANAFLFYQSHEYAKYKEKFILEEGCKSWDEASEEAGIHNELQSFIHYIMYKK